MKSNIRVTRIVKDEKGFTAFSFGGFYCGQFGITTVIKFEAGTGVKACFNFKFFSTEILGALREFPTQKEQNLRFYLQERKTGINAAVSQAVRRINKDLPYEKKFFYEAYKIDNRIDSINFWGEISYLVFSNLTKNGEATYTIFCEILREDITKLEEKVYNALLNEITKELKEDGIEQEITEKLEMIANSEYAIEDYTDWKKFYVIDNSLSEQELRKNYLLYITETIEEYMPELLQETGKDIEIIDIEKKQVPLDLQMFASAVSGLVLSPEDLKERKEKREKDKAQQQVINICQSLNWNIDEHGGFAGHGKYGTSTYNRGDYFSISILDILPYKKSYRKPYFNMSKDHLPLSLVRLNRKRVYARSSNWFPHTTSSLYLVGQNESGTYFAHAVSSRLQASDKRRNNPTLLDALLWIWNCPLDLLLRRQGDIAVVKSSGRSHVLPAGHMLQGDMIIHETHPSIQAPGKGEKIIVGRRAKPAVDGQTRD